MTNVLLLHHAQGKTGGVVAIAERLRAEGHTVHVPDLYDGRTFDSLDDGLAYAQQVGFEALQRSGVAAAEELGEPLAVIGISLGVMAAQQLAQTRPGVTAAVLIASCLPAEEFGAWPDAVPVEVHGATGDPVFTEEGDLDAAQALVASAADARLYTYDVPGHLFVDSTLPDADPDATDEVLAHTIALLRRTA